MGISYLNFTQIIQQAVGTFTSTRINNYISKQTLRSYIYTTTRKRPLIQRTLSVFLFVDSYQILAVSLILIDSFFWVSDNQGIVKT